MGDALSYCGEELPPKKHVCFVKRYSVKEKEKNNSNALLSLGCVSWKPNS